MAVSSSLFFVLSLSETDARVEATEAVEAIAVVIELAAFAFAAASSKDLAFSINSLLRFRNFSSALSNSLSPELPKITLESLSAKKTDSGAFFAHLVKSAFHRVLRLF